MNLIEKIRCYGSNYYLKKGLASLSRNKKLIHIDSATSIAILFELTDEAVYYSIQKYFQKLQEKKVKVKAIGFANNKQASDQFLPVLSFDFFNAKQISWFRVPKAQSIQDFIESDFDICINLASEDVFPLKYIAALSKSRLKVGAYHNEMVEAKYKELGNIYDIMMMVEDNHNQIEFLNQVQEYLTILNPKENV
jgi:hypothetical protein